MEQQSYNQPQQGQPTQGGYPAGPQAQYAVAGTQPDLVKRAIAAVIDFVGIGIVLAVVNIPLALVLGRFGIAAASLAGLAAVLIRDVALQGRSPGKKIMGLAVVGPDGGPINMNQSVMRNSTLAIGMAGNVLAVIPFLGWLLSILIGLVGFAVGCYELYNVVTNQPRLGDKLAGGTRVVLQGQAAIAL